MDLTPIPTGLSQLDNLLDGGIPRGRVTLLTSLVTAMGKTSLAVTIAYHVSLATRYSVTYLTLEGRNKDIVYKFFAMDTGIDAWDMRRGKTTDEEHAQVKAASERIKQGQFFVSDYLKKSVQDIRRDFEETRSDLVVIDYLELLRDTDEHYLQVLTDLQHLAEEWGVAFLAVTQIRSFWNPVFPMGRPGTLLLLNRQEEEAQVTVLRENEIAQVRVYFHPTTTRFFGDRAECIEAYGKKK